MNLTVERLRAVLDYDPLTGVFVRLVKTSNNVDMSKPPGYVSDQGYLIISVDGREYRAHRLAWLHVTGEWPSNLIDHENEIRLDNRFSNLRDLTKRGNMENQSKPYSGNSSGILGVSRCRRTGRWVANIKSNYRSQYLGRFAKKLDAQAAYLAAKALLHADASSFKEVK